MQRLIRSCNNCSRKTDTIRKQSDVVNPNYSLSLEGTSNEREMKKKRKEKKKKIR